FQFKPVELARAGLTVATAPVLVPCDTPLVAEAAKRKAMPKGAQIALRALAEAIDEVGNLMPASNHIPARTKTVTFQQWRTYAYGRGISTSAEPRARQQAFKRATEYLIGEEHVGAWDNQSMVHERTGESERVGDQSEHPLRGVFAMFARTPRTLGNIVRLVRYVRHRQSSAKLGPMVPMHYVTLDV